MAARPTVGGFAPVPSALARWLSLPDSLSPLPKVQCDEQWQSQALYSVCPPQKRPGNGSVDVRHDHRLWYLQAMVIGVAHARG